MFVALNQTELAPSNAIQSWLAGWMFYAGFSRWITSAVAGLVFIMIAAPSVITVRKLGVGGRFITHKSWKAEGGLLHSSLDTWDHTLSLQVRKRERGCVA